MKKTIFAIAALSLVLTSCQPSQKKSDSTCEKKGTCCKQESMTMEKFEAIKLLPAQFDCKISLMEAVKNRKSYREFAETNLSLNHLSNVLWMANGVNREDGKRTVPSAMALYPLETYAVLANGIYHYDPVAHLLNPVVEGDFRELSGLQPFVNNAPLNLVFIANYNKYNGDRKVPEHKRLYLAALDAGHCTQNIYLYCAAVGLKSVVRAGAKEKELLEVLKLDENYQFVVAHTVGY